MSFERFNRFAGVRVTGLQEATRGIENIIRGFGPAAIKTIAETQDFFVNEAQRRVHKISHTLEKSIRADPVHDNRGDVVADTDYARKEEERLGNKEFGRGTGIGTPHAYMAPSKPITQIAMQGFVIKNFDALFRSKG